MKTVARRIMETRVQVDRRVSGDGIFTPPFRTVWARWTATLKLELARAMKEELMPHLRGWR